MDVNQAAPVQPVGPGGGHGGGGGATGDKQDKEEKNQERPTGHTDPAINVSGLLGMDGLTPEAQHALERMAAELEPLRHQVEQLQAALEAARDLTHRHAVVPGLNRRGFLAELEKIIHRLGTTEARPALILLHLENGDDIRRTQGLQAHDGALRQVYEIISADSHQALMSGILSGNDFALVVLESGLDGARQKAGQIADQLRQAHTPDGLFLQARIGVALLEPGMTPEAAIDHADRDFR